MKKCSYCGRDNEDAVTICSECGTDEFKSELPPAAAREEPEPPGPIQRRTLTPEERQMAFVTLRRCRTVDEANLLLTQLKSADIDAFLPDETLMSTLAWNANGYGFVRVQVPTEQYDRAVDFLAESEPPAKLVEESEEAERNGSLPLSWPMRFLMVFLLPIGICPGLIIAALICEYYRKKGYKRRTEEAYLLLLASTACWLLLALLLRIAVMG